jgi:alkanesulfonate monooxygenase SsuD/methylene tetrahydromethanopterin reductase-like flavin-dependent oxidoreductase (luciferase family)
MWNRNPVFAFLAAAAQHTSKIRLGPLVYLLPLYDPSIAAVQGWRPEPVLMPHNGR